MGSKVVILSRSFGQYFSEPGEYLERAGLKLIRLTSVEEIETILSPDQLNQVEAMIVGLERIDEVALAKFPHLKVISKHGVGVDNVDVEACTRKGVVVTNIPDVNCEAVAELTFGLLLALARQIPQANQSTKAGQWQRFLGVSLSGKKLGIVGLGAIGKQMVPRAQGFRMEVLAYDIALDRAFCSRHRVKGAGLEELLSSSDFVTLHLPADASTHNLIKRRELRLMKREAFLINTARGGIVNEKDLYESLLAGEIAGAALDVFGEEPPRDSPLFKLDNVVVTPHIGAYTREVLREMSLRTARNVVEVMRGKRIKHVVNPEVYEKTPRRG